MGVRENKKEMYLHEEITAIGGMTRKWENQHYSVPDRIVIYKGEVWFVEIKTTAGVLSSAQVREQERLKKAGARVVTLCGKDEIDQFLIALQMNL